MRYVTFLVLFLSSHVIGLSQTTWYVPDDFTEIQTAISSPSVLNGDTIIVRPGTYVENIDFLGKAITLKSELGPDVTAIDGNQAGSVVSCQSFEGATTTLEGFTITNGSGHLSFPQYFGGGMYNVASSPTVTNCTFSGNSADSGGGMFNLSSSPTVTDCTFSGNSSDRGGGMLNDTSSNPTMTNCTFSGNSADKGGGVHNDSSSPTLTNCTFSANSGKWGGGMHNSLSSNPTLTNCTFSGNSVDTYGGGMYNYTSSPTVTDCTFSCNSADSDGGGMYNFLYSDPTVTNCTFSDNSADTGGGMYNYTDSDPTVTNCTFSGNSAGSLGGGMYNVSSSPTLTNCTFSGNSAYWFGGGMYNYNNGDPTVTNCILWNDTPDEIQSPSSSPTVTYSCIQGGHAGTGNIDQDPLFVGGIIGDFHLSFLSPCKDTGDTAAIPPGLLEDYEGNPRIAYGTVDMGADEFYTHLYYTGDPTPGGYVEGKLIGLPGTSPVWLVFGSGILEPPIPTQYGDFYLEAPRVFVPLMPIPSDGVLVIPETVPVSPPAPYDHFLQGVVGLNADSLTSLCVLEVR